MVCSKCSKETEEIFKSLYGDIRCKDCWYDYILTDRGMVEYVVWVVRGDYPVDYFDADFLGHCAVQWNKHRDEFDMTLLDLYEIEEKARAIGLL